MDVLCYQFEGHIFADKKNKKFNCKLSYVHAYCKKLIASYFFFNSD